MAKTGNVIVTERDINPYSSTYNQTRTVTTVDYTRCAPFDSGNKLFVKEYSSSTTRTLACNGDSNLPSSETMGSASDHFMIVGDCVTTIGENFYRKPTSGSTGGYGLRELYLPDTIISIGAASFYNIDCLDSVYIFATIPPTIGSGAFMYPDASIGQPSVIPTFYVPAESVEAYKTAWGSAYASKIYALPYS